MNEGESTIVAADYLPLIPRAESIPGSLACHGVLNKNWRNLFIATKLLLCKNRGPPLRNRRTVARGRSHREEGSSLDSSKDRHVNPIPLETRRTGRVSYNKMHVLRIPSAARSRSSPLYFRRGRKKKLPLFRLSPRENRSGGN